MRLPHHLIRSPHGLFHFRQVVPIDLRSAFGLRVIKRSLYTRDPAVAQMRVYALSTYVSISFSRARRLVMGEHDGKPVDINDPASPFYIPLYKVEKTQYGFSLETDGSAADHARALEALRMLLGTGCTSRCSFVLWVDHPAVADERFCPVRFLIQAVQSIDDRLRSYRAGAMMGP